MNILAIHPPDAELKDLKFKGDEAGQVTFQTRFVPGPWDLIVQWGQPESFQNGRTPTLNPTPALRAAADPELTKALLAAHKLSPSYYELGRRGKARTGARYRLHVHDLRILAVSRQVKGRFKSVSLGRSNRADRIRQVAVRAVYYLGLHFAAVDVGVFGKKRAVVLRIDPAPKLSRRTGRLYAKATSAYAQRRMRRALPNRRPVMIGADPEFIMKRNDGGIVYASRFFSRRGRIGYDQQGSWRHRGRGLKPIAEVRPAPSENPIELVARIKALLQRAGRRAPRKGVRWEAGSLPVKGYPIGGHIHFSRVDLTTELLRALDNYLALPVALLESPEKARKRRPKYGFLGEFRWQGYGGFEYRVLSSWIVAPHFALAVITLAKLIADNYEHLNRNFLVDPEFARMFYSSDKDGLRDAFEALWSDIEALEDYPKVEKYVEVIPRLVRENKRWHESQDLRVRWGLVSKRSLASKKRKRKR